MRPPIFQSIHLHRLWFCLEQISFLESPLSIQYFQDADHKKVLFDKLMLLDKQASTLEQRVRSLGPMPMGRYFEHLVLIALEQEERYALLAHNEQIIKDKITLGELDLVLENRLTNSREHWEVALKFYLQMQASPAHEVFWGPSGKDRLSQKMSLLLEKQLKLGQSPLVSEKYGPLKAGLLLKGQLFFRLSADGIPPEAWHPQATKGHWILSSQIEEFMEAAPCKYRILQKPEWMAPYFSSSEETLLEFPAIKEALKEAFSRTGRPQLLVAMRKNGGFWLEEKRRFVVPERSPLLPNSNDYIR